VRNAPLEREDDALSALIEKLGASRAQGPDLPIGRAAGCARATELLSWNKILRTTGWVGT
jgi:hypothetical protein